MRVKHSILAPLAVLLLAAFLRLHRLATVPFGWHPDEATKALLARDVLAGEYFPAFFSAFTGREALFVYLEAALFALLGEGMFVGRLLSALLGIVTVVLTYATGKELFGRRVGLMAAAFLAVSLWHLIASRNGYRAVIQPFVQLVVIWLLFRGLHAGRVKSTQQALPYFVAAGVALGLTQYTYTAVRVFPFLVLVLLALAFLFAWRTTRRNLLSLALMGFVAALVFLPLGWHFWQNPLDFYGRAAQISVFSPEWAGGDPWARLWQSMKETARMWTVWGDINYRFNISGEPVFGWLDGLLFYGGLLLVPYLAWRSRGLRRVAYLGLLLWLLIMLVPMLLSAESLPYYQRAIGTLPVVYLFPALALNALITPFSRYAGRHFSRLRTDTILSLLLLAFFGWLTVRTYDAYFVNWHESPRNDDDRRVAMVYVADYLAERRLAGDIYVSTQYVQHPTLALLAPERYEGIHWFDARQSFPLPPENAQATYILLAENAPQSRLLTAAADLIQLDEGQDRFGRPVFQVYRWSGGEHPTPSDQTPAIWSWETTFVPGDPQNLRNPITLPVAFGDVMRFMGHDRSATVLAPGETLELVLHWQLLRKPERQYTIFAHVLNGAGEVVAGFDANDYPTSFWRPDGGEWLMSYMPLTLPPDLAPGEYQLEIGVYNQESGERLPLLENDRPVADRLLLEPLKVQ